MTNASITVVCYKWKTLANGEHPLMLCICKDGKRKYKSLGISVNPKYWSFTKNAPKVSCPNKDLIQQIILDKKAELQNRVLELNIENKTYTAYSLMNAQNEKFRTITVEEFYSNLIDQYAKSEKCGNRLIYKGSFNSLKTFNRGKLDIPFSDIDHYCPLKMDGVKN